MAQLDYHIYPLDKEVTIQLANTLLLPFIPLDKEATIQLTNKLLLPFIPLDKEVSIQLANTLLLPFIPLDKEATSVNLCKYKLVGKAIRVLKSICSTKGKSKNI